MKTVKLLGLAAFAVIIFMVLWGLNVINAAFFENLNPFSERPEPVYEELVTPPGAGMPPAKPRASLGPELLLKAARAGVPEAQYDVGTDLYYGAEDVEKDVAKSVDWFRSAADKDYPQSITALAHVIRQPEVKAKDRAKQLKWIRAQAEGGSGEAGFVMGRFSEYGFLGFKVDPDMAESWYQRAAEAGNMEAAAKLAADQSGGDVTTIDMSQFGFDPELLKKMIDDVTASRNAKAAREGGDVEDVEALLARASGLSAAEREGLLGRLNKMRQTDVLALSDKGYPDAQNQAGLNAYNGQAGAKAEAFTALTLFWEAATAGHEMAYQNLGTVLNHRDISEAQRQPALSWIAGQADKGNAQAQNLMGDVRRYGYFGYEKDPELGAVLERRAAEAGVVGAQSDYGFALTIGSGVPEDDAEGVRWLTKAAEQGDAPGQYWLAKAYQRGEGIETDHFKAVEWYEKAFSRGYSSADLSLVMLLSDTDSPARNDAKAMAYAEYMIKETNGSVAHQYVGDFYKAGRHYPQSDEKAVEHYRMAADAGVGSSQFRLAEMILEGRGTPQDEEAAIALLKKAANNYSVSAQFKLKDMGIDYEEP